MRPAQAKSRERPEVVLGSSGTFQLPVLILILLVIQIPGFGSVEEEIRLQQQPKCPNCPPFFKHPPQAKKFRGEPGFSLPRCSRPLDCATDG